MKIMDEKFHRIGDISIAEAVNRCIKVYGIEGTEDKVKELYSHKSLHELRDLWLEELKKRYK